MENDLQEEEEDTTKTDEKQPEKTKEKHFFINNIKINTGSYNLKNIKKESQTKFLRSNAKTQYWDQSEFDDEIVAALFKNEKLSLESRLPRYNHNFVTQNNMTTSRLLSRDKYNVAHNSSHKN